MPNMFGTTDGLEGRTGKTQQEAYYTPVALVEKVLDELHLPRQSTILEPSAGGGAWARGLAKRGHRVHVLDIDPNCWAVQNEGWRPEHGPGVIARAHVGDFATYDFGDVCFDAVVGNPPFKLAEAHVRRAHEVSARCMFLLRQAFTSSQERIPFWLEHEQWWAGYYPLVERPREWPAAYDYAIFEWVWGLGLFRPNATRCRRISWRAGA